MNATQAPHIDTLEPTEPTEPPPEWEGTIFDGSGSTYGSRPPAFLRATSDELYLCGNRGTFRIPRSHVWKIGLGDFHPWRFCSIQIHHRVSSCPNQIQFKPSVTTPRSLLEQLRALGYPTT